MSELNKNSKIYLAGHRGLVGSAVERSLRRHGYTNLVTRTHHELDLTRQLDVERFFELEKPDAVILSAAKVGGIGANSQFPADFLYENLAIAQNIIHSSWKSGVKKLVNLGSSCIYPRMAPQPLREDSLLTGPLETTNEAYAVAKIAAIRLCKHYNDQYGTNFISLMPTNMYGPGDNYDLKTSHVLPALIRKFHEAKVGGTEVTLWGHGSALREFLYSDDLADAVVFLFEHKDYADLGELINVGSGVELSIRELAEMIKSIVGYSGNLVWDTTKPDGTPRKLLDSSRLRSFGWKPQVDLNQGIRLAYEDFLRK